MKLRLIAVGFVLGAAVALSTTQVFSGDSRDDAAARQEMARKWQRYATPSAGHDPLEHFVGDWDVTVKFWMEGPDKPPTESGASFTGRMIFGGRFLETKMLGVVTMGVEPDTMEVPFQAVGYVGFNNFKQMYESVWIDSQGTAIGFLRGTLDEAGKVFTYVGKSDDWQTGQRDKAYKFVDRIIDENTTISQMFDVSGPDQVKVFEMEARRRK